MTPVDKVTTFRLDDDLLKDMEALRERDGIPFSEQIRRALRMWLETKGVSQKTDRKRATTRKRS